MKKLQQKIKNLENKLNKDNIKMRQDLAVINQQLHVNSPTFIIGGSIAGFATGYLFSNKIGVTSLLRIGMLNPQFIPK